jgi:hypothetical protein
MQLARRNRALPRPIDKSHGQAMRAAGHPDYLIFRIRLRKALLESSLPLDDIHQKRPSL